MGWIRLKVWGRLYHIVGMGSIDLGCVEENMGRMGWFGCNEMTIYVLLMKVAKRCNGNNRNPRRF